jgi:hypothetical protein
MIEGACQNGAGILNSSQSEVEARIRGIAKVRLRLQLHRHTEHKWVTAVPNGVAAGCGAEVQHLLCGVKLTWFGVAPRALTAFPQQYDSSQRHHMRLFDY